VQTRRRQRRLGSTIPAMTRHGHLVVVSQRRSSHVLYQLRMGQWRWRQVI
jgi:hypothetical protein